MDICLYNFKLIETKEIYNEYMKFLINEYSIL